MLRNWAQSTQRVCKLLKNQADSVDWAVKPHNKQTNKIMQMSSETEFTPIIFAQNRYFLKIHTPV